MKGIRPSIILSHDFMGSDNVDGGNIFIDSQSPKTFCIVCMRHNREMNVP